jgi:hypothetical protein
VNDNTRCPHGHLWDRCEDCAKEEAAAKQSQHWPLPVPEPEASKEYTRFKASQPFIPSTGTMKADAMRSAFIDFIVEQQAELERLKAQRDRWHYLAEKATWCFREGMFLLHNHNPYSGSWFVRDVTRRWDDRHRDARLSRWQPRKGGET